MPIGLSRILVSICIRIMFNFRSLSGLFYTNLLDMQGDVTPIAELPAESHVDWVQLELA